MSTPEPTMSGPANGSSRAGLRVGDLLTGTGALLALISTFLPYEKSDFGHLTVWHSDFLSPLFAVILAIAAAVVGIVFASRSTPLVGKLGLTAGALAALASAAAVLFYAAGIITFSQAYLATVGPVLGSLGIISVAVGTFGLALAAPGAGLAKKLGGSGAPRATVVQPNFGQFAPGGPMPAYGYGQPQSGQPVPHVFAPVESSAGGEPASPFANPISAPTLIARSDDTIAGVVAPSEAARPAQAATFSPYWAGVTAPIPAFSPADANGQVGEVTPGQWYLVTGQHPLGLLLDLGGRPVLVRDVNALVRG